MGFHLNALVNHITAKKKSHDFVEMVVHHLVTFYLYGFSYLSNCFIGAVIAVLHDVADIFVCIARFWGESKWTWPGGVALIITIILWGYTRCIVFPKIIYVIYEVPVYAVGVYNKPIFIFLLTCLLVLHFYWIFLLIKMMLIFLI